MQGKMLLSPCTLIAVHDDKTLTCDYGVGQDNNVIVGDVGEAAANCQRGCASTNLVAQCSLPEAGEEGTMAREQTEFPVAAGRDDHLNRLADQQLLRCGDVKLETIADLANLYRSRFSDSDGLLVG